MAIEIVDFPIKHGDFPVPGRVSELWGGRSLELGPLFCGTAGSCGQPQVLQLEVGK